MRLRTKAVTRLSMVLCLVLLSVAAAAAQTVTTGSVAGTVTDAQGGVLPGATVTALHTPTGTTYEAVTDANGRFNILNVRVGPYTISVTMGAFKDQKQENVDVGLGQERTADFKLQLATVSETIEVIAQSPQIDLSRAGTADNISNSVKETLPTITRSIPDIVRISPLFNSQGSGSGDGASVVSVGGNSFRYNSLQIDGAVNNDLFGLAGSAGAPGGAAETQPISLDAIQEIQLVVSPYDVRQGGFSGGGITRSRRAAPTACTAPRFSSAAIRTGSARASPTRRFPRSKTSRGAPASAGLSSRTRRSTSAPRISAVSSGPRGSRSTQQVSSSSSRRFSTATSPI